MTQKELLYVEDAYGHEKNMVTILNETLKNLSNDNLKEFIESEINKHALMQNELLNLLKEKVYE